MKYIRGQDGGIYSVAQLKPPCRVSNEGEPTWRLLSVATNGSIHAYATYSTEKEALLAYKGVGDFMYTDDDMMRFNLGIDGLPDWMEKE